MRAVESGRVRSVGVQHCDELMCDADTVRSLVHGAAVLVDAVGSIP